MPRQDQQVVWATIVFTFLTALPIFIIAHRFHLPLVPLAVLLAPITIVVVFINTDAALVLLIFSMLLSPEIKLADVPQRAVVVRIDDVLLLLVFFGWLAKVAINKQLGFLKNTYLNAPIAMYILVCIISTCLAIMLGGVHPLKSSFYILKYVEYFLLFFMFTNNIKTPDQLKMFIIALMMTCAVTCVFSLITVTEIGRATAPFEGPKGEPNTLGGYLVLMFSLCMGIFLYDKRRKWRVYSALLMLLIFPTLLQTLSRSSYVSFILMFLVITVLTKRRKMTLLSVALMLLLILPFAVPDKVVKRVRDTFRPQAVYVTPIGKELALDQSSAARVETWKWVFDAWKKKMFFGYGLSGLGLIDAQYPRVLAETGIIGFGIFLWMLYRLLRLSLERFRDLVPDWQKGIVLGFLGGFVALLLHGVAASTFIIVRIMEPFWFLAAVVTMLPYLETVSEPMGAGNAV